MPKGKIEVSPEQAEQIEVLRAQIAEIRNAGKFDKFYRDLRNMTITIKKDSSLTDLEKKKRLSEELAAVALELEESLK